MLIRGAIVSIVLFLPIVVAIPYFTGKYFTSLIEVHANTTDIGYWVVGIIAIIAILVGLAVISTILYIIAKLLGNLSRQYIFKR